MERHELLDRFDLTDRVAIVTGGSRGIGRAVVDGFAAMGAKVVVASRNAEACNQAVAEVEATGGVALAHATHVGRLDELEALVAATVDRFGGLDIVVNNAATPLAQPLGSLTPEVWQKSFDVNLRGPVFLVQHALPHLRKSHHPAVVNVISAAVFTQAPLISMYAAAKSGLLSMTRSMAAELSADGVRVNALAPGATETDMVHKLTPEMHEALMAGQLLPGMSTPMGMVPAVLFLASDASSFMTGHVLVLDGGLTVH